MPQISVIMPLYNAEEYLAEAIDSIVYQSFKDYELLLINDGSTDASANICNNYASIYANIKVFHTLNQGVSVARNLGILNASGTFITFVDADDYLESTALEILLKNAIESKADISIVNNFIIKKTYTTVHNAMIAEKEILTPYEGIYQLLTDKIPFVPWAKLYRTSLFKIVTFPENVAYCEDAYINLRLFSVANKIVYDTKPLYHYRLIENSSTNKDFAKKAVTGLNAWNDNIDFLNIRYPDLKKLALSCYYRKLFDLFNLLLKRGVTYADPVYIIFYKQLKEGISILKKSSNASFKRKTMLNILSLSPLFYYIIRKFYWNHFEKV